MFSVFRDLIRYNAEFAIGLVLVGLVVITLLGVIVLRGSRKITRLEGAVLVAAYVAFIVCAALL